MCHKGENCMNTNDEKIKVLVIRPNKYPKIIEIENTLEAMQRVVGGRIEPFYLDDNAVIICNDEGKMNGLPLNRAVYENNEISKEMSYQEMRSLFYESENAGKHINGYVVFAQDSFNQPYSLESRTYVINSDNKAFQSSKGGYSIYGSSLDGTDKNVRLERYMYNEHGGKDGWKIEKCYVKEVEKEMIEIIAGDFFICYAPPESENFKSLPDNLINEYMKIFKYPERFSKVNGEITATKVTPKEPVLER